MTLIQEIRDGLRVSETQFNKIFEHDVRDIARTHWTPFDVAVAAMDLLTQAWTHDERFNILDVGSNVGKFCLIGALRSAAHFLGVEIRRDFVDLARKIARANHIECVRFIWSDMNKIDDKVLLSPKQHALYAHATQATHEFCDQPNLELWIKD